MPRWVLFIDDGGVMNDNALRGPQWQRLIGEFLPPILGGTSEAWAAANGVVAERLGVEYSRTMFGRVEIDYAAYDRADRLAWLGGMCELVGVPAPPEEEALDLTRRAAEHVTRRVRSAFPGVVETIRALHADGYRLHTASGEYSADLHGYLEGMGVRSCFGRLYGPDLINTLKEGPEYYARLFADAGVHPREAFVIDDRTGPLIWAAQAGARTALVTNTPPPDASPDVILPNLAALPQALGDR